MEILTLNNKATLKIWVDRQRGVHQRWMSMALDAGDKISIGDEDGHELVEGGMVIANSKHYLLEPGDKIKKVEQEVNPVEKELVSALDDFKGATFDDEEDDFGDLAYDVEDDEYDDDEEL